MAKQDVNFIDQHIEKVVVGVCGAVFLGAAWFGFSGSRFAVEEKSPAELNKALEEAAEATRQAALNARYSPPRKETANPQDDPVVQLSEWFGENAKGLVELAGLQKNHPRAQPFPAPFISVMKTSPEDRHELAELVAPGLPVATSGRTNFRLYRELFEVTGYDPRNNWYGVGEGFEAEKSWVTIAAQVDLIEQTAKFIEQKYPSNAGLQIVRVHLQRKDLTDSSRGWEDVNGFLPYELPKRPAAIVQSDGRIKIDGLESFRSAIRDSQNLLIAPPLPELVNKKDKVEVPRIPYLDEPPPTNRVASTEEATRRVKNWSDLARAAMEGKRPFKDPDMNAAIVLAKAAVATPGARDKEMETAKLLLNKIIEKAPKELRDEARARPRAPEALMPIMAHDFTALPGHTYTYRIRYEALNLYAGNASELKNPADAAKVTIFSDWSPETRPIEITSDIYFYLTKADKPKKEVVVTVFKVSRRGALKQDFRISAGEEIGKKDKKGNRIDFTTGAVCVDIDFEREIDGKKEIALVYVDKLDGSLHERVLSRDLKDKVYRRLAETRTAQP